jgi:hypothetical protein
VERRLRGGECNLSKTLPRVLEITEFRFSREFRITAGKIAQLTTERRAIRKHDDKLGSPVFNFFCFVARNTLDDV